MQIPCKALYNLLRLNHLEDPTLICEEWQIEDLRLLGDEELFFRLQQLHRPIDKNQFLSFAQTVETPEELTEILLDDDQEIQVRDKIYLIIFELWRRLLPHKQSLSIFCDELDYRIFFYDQGSLDSDENIQEILAYLEEILDENAMGAEPQEVFQNFAEYCAQDIEGFLHDYISEQIDAGYEFYAKDLLDSFYPYMSELKWFDFLRARLEASTDSIEARRIIELLLNELKEEPDLDLQLEMLRFIVQTDCTDLFSLLLQNTLPILQTEDDFQEVMEIASDFSSHLNQEVLQTVINRIMLQKKQKEIK